MWCEQLEGDVRASQLRQTEDKKALELSETERKSLVFQVDELRSAVDKAKAESETLQRAKKSLEAQLDRMNDELGEDGRNVSETRKVNKKLESTIERVREPALTDAAGREWVPPPLPLRQGRSSAPLGQLGDVHRGRPAIWLGVGRGPRWV